MLMFPVGFILNQAETGSLKDKHPHSSNQYTSPERKLVQAKLAAQKAMLRISGGRIKETPDLKREPLKNG